MVKHEEDILIRARLSRCFMKKMFGNTSEFNTVLRTYVPEAYIEPVSQLMNPNVFISHFGDSPLFNMFNDGGVATPRTHQLQPRQSTSDTSISDAIETLMKIFKGL